MTETLKGRILVYSIVGCPHCLRAKSTLQELGLPYTDVSLDSYDDSVRQSVKDRTGKQTVPQIFFNAEYIGGNDDLQTLVADKDRLQEAIDNVRNNEPPPDAPQIPDPSLAKADTSGDLEFQCELDECALLVRDLKSSGLIKDHRKGLLSSHKNSFIGREFVDWIVKTKQVERERAVEMGQSLLQKGFGHQLSGKTDGDVIFKDDNEVYRLLEYDESGALNSGIVSECEPRPASSLSEDLRKLILSIYNDHLSKDGKAVDYKAIGADPKFEKYVKATGELARVDIQSATREEKLAFFINIYNALVIHATVKRGPPVNVWQRYKFFTTTSYIIGGLSYTLHDIENGVLRSNRRGVATFRPQFGSGDPRLKIMLEKCEPLIHFALVCGAKSCPPIKTYSAEGIYDKLNIAAEAFLESSDGCEVLADKKLVKLSAILKWYRVDFGNSNEEVVQWVYDHLADGEKKTNLKKLLDHKDFKVQFMSYDWGLNSK